MVDPHPRDAAAPQIVGGKTDFRADPLEVLGDDIFLSVLRHLSERQLLKCALVSASWRTAATCDSLWKPICLERWQGKVYNPAAALNIPWKRRYLAAEAHRKRTDITHEEVVAFTWRFR